MENMLITSGYNFEGYEITDYLGLCSGEAALGTGFLSSLGAGIADFLGTNSTLYEEKLNSARNIALDNLVQDARAFGANALIAVHMEYTAFSADVIGVTANGTAVKIQKKSHFPDTKIDILNFNPNIPARPANFFLTLSSSGYCLQLVLADISDNSISAIKGDLTFLTIFEEEYKFENVYFYEFMQKGSSKISAPTPFVFPAEIAPIIKCASFDITKYIDDTKIIDNISHDNEQVFSSDSSELLQYEYVSYIKSLNSANEIYNYTIEFNAKHEDFVPSDLIKSIKALDANERIYGNLAKDCIQKIISYYQTN